MRKINISKEAIEEKLKSGKSQLEVAKELNVALITLTNYIRLYGIKRSSLLYNENYFDIINTEEKAYWLGFLTADGCIWKSGDNSLNLEFSLQAKDKYLVEQFKNCICPTKELSFNKKNQYRVTLTNTKICSVLIEKYGLIPNKTYNIINSYENILTKIDLVLHRHFIRGFFDGDGGYGTITYSTCKKKTKRLMKMSFANSNYKFLESIVPYFKFTGSNCNIVKRDPFCNILTINLNTNNIPDVYDFFYKDSSIFMIRKRDVMLQHLRENTEITKELMILWHCRA